MDLNPVVFFVIVFGFIFLARRAVKHDAEVTRKKNAEKYAASPVLHCMSCGEDFKQQTSQPLRGSTFIEVVLWLCYIIPGVIYSHWRRSEKFKSVCHVCHSSQVVPATSRAAIAHIKTLEKSIS